MSGKHNIGYRDVSAEILYRIKSKIWPPGTLMPGEVSLANEFGCARATVNRALRELAEAGIIDRKRKAGTRVSLAPVRNATIEIPMIRSEIEASGATYRYALVNRSILEIPDWLRTRLGLTKGDRVLHLQCMHYSNGAPYQFEDRWINIAAVPDVEHADFTSIGPNEWLIREVPFSDAEFSFRATAAPEYLAEFLSVMAGDPVFTAERITWLLGQPVTYARMSFAQGYRMTTQIRKHS